MPSRVPEKVDWLTAEIFALKARMGANPNEIQLNKLDLLSDILSDYKKSLERSQRG